MIKFLAGIVAGVTLGTAAAATATTRQHTFYLHRGDVAVARGGDTQCAVIANPRPNTKPGVYTADAFRCFVGGDYRGRYGTIIGSYEVDLTKYTGFKNYTVILRMRQSPVG